MMTDEDIEDSGADEETETPKPKKSKKGKKVEKAKVKANGKAKPEKKAKKEQEDDGLIRLSDLAETAGISGAAARRKLRAAELERGDGRWAWEDGSTALKQAKKALGL